MYARYDTACDSGSCGLVLKETDFRAKTREGICLDMAHRILKSKHDCTRKTETEATPEKLQTTKEKPLQENQVTQISPVKCFLLGTPGTDSFLAL